MGGKTLKRSIGLVLVWVAMQVASSGGSQSDTPRPVVARRLPQNPLITVSSSPTLGDNVNGPTVVRTPSWIKQPLGRYYMYFAHHKGEFIRLAYANAIEGPWRIHEPGVLHVRDTAFYRPQPDPVNSPPGFYTHVASPEIHLDDSAHKVVLWFHGWFTNGERWPLEGAAAWARDRGYAQFTQVAESDDGIHFTVRAPITRESYLRVFRHEGRFYGLARLGALMRAQGLFAPFEEGPSAFRDGPYEGRVRHVALRPRNGRLEVFFSGIRDAPERILMSSIELRGSWDSWKASPPVEVIQPEAPYECPELPSVPSVAGDVEGRVKQMRDPAVFEDSGRAWLFYTICGEQGIAAAELVG